MKSSPVCSLFHELMEADAVVRPCLIAAWRSEHPVMAREIDQMWNKYGQLTQSDRIGDGENSRVSRGKISRK